MNSIVAYEEEIGSTLSVGIIKHQIQAIQELMRDTMVEGTHFGVIPGCGDKPTLLKPGAEKLSLMFRLSPTYVITKSDIGNGHREIEVRCTLTHIPSGKVFGEGVGSCSTAETKYRYRNAERLCPKCGKDKIIKGKDEYGGGWLCYAKKGGCGAKFKDADESITSQIVGRVENPDVADTFNTVLKMAKKRAHVDAALTATGASDIFAQDLEDLPKDQVTVTAEVDDGPQPVVKIAADVKRKIIADSLDCINRRDEHGLKQIWDEWDPDHSAVLWGLFNSQQRSTMKQMLNDAKGH